MSEQRVRLGMSDFVYDGPGTLESISLDSRGRLQLTISDVHRLKEKPVEPTPPPRRSLWEWMFG